MKRNCVNRKEEEVFILQNLGVIPYYYSYTIATASLLNGSLVQLDQGVNCSLAAWFMFKLQQRSKSAS